MKNANSHDIIYDIGDTFHVVLSKENRADGSSAHSYQCAESDDNVHQRERYGKSGDSHWPYTTSDKNRVDYIVERSRKRSYNGRDRILHEQASYRTGTEV